MMRQKSCMCEHRASAARSAAEMVTSCRVNIGPKISQYWRYESHFLNYLQSLTRPRVAGIQPAADSTVTVFSGITLKFCQRPVVRLNWDVSFLPFHVCRAQTGSGNMCPECSETAVLHSVLFSFQDALRCTNVGFNRI